MSNKKVAISLFVEFCLSHGLPEPMPEHTFHPERKWRLDWVFPSRVAIEVQGGIWNKGKHGRGSGITKDYEKINTAQLMGWIVLQFTPEQINSGIFASVVKDALDFRVMQGYDWRTDDVVGFPNHVKRGMALDARFPGP